MPHKRAKLCTRQSERTKRGTDLPPTGGVSLAQESVPKSMARVLQAEDVRKAYRQKRARNEETTEAGTGDREQKRRKKDPAAGQRPMGIKHGESLAQYNRRVEEEMRIPVAEAMHTSRSSAKRARKADAEAKAAKAAASKPKSKPDPSKDVPAPAPAIPTPAGKTEFDKKASTTRLNDIVHAPPSFTKLPRGAAKRRAQGSAVSGMSDGVLSMAQKQMMEEERERAIRRYRELKETRAAA